MYRIDERKAKNGLGKAWNMDDARVNDYNREFLESGLIAVGFEVVSMVDFSRREKGEEYVRQLYDRADGMADKWHEMVLNECSSSGLDGLSPFMVYAMAAMSSIKVAYDLISEANFMAELEDIIGGEDEQA